MGDIWDVNKLELFLAFFIPGFVSLQIYGLFVGVDDSDFAKRLPAVVGYSAIHYALTGWILFIVPEGIWRGVTGYVIVLILPIFWPPLILLFRDRERWRVIFFKNRRVNWQGILEAMVRPEATPWDRVLTPTPRWIRVKLKSGRFVGGFFGRGSTVSTYPCEHQIFISNAFAMDQGSGKFLYHIPNTGLLVDGSEIEVLETIESELQSDV